MTHTTTTHHGPVIHRAGGCLAQIVEWTSQPHSVRHRARIWWRDGTPRCCPGEPMQPWGSDAAPVWLGSTYGVVVPVDRQCGRCGSRHRAPVSITRLRRKDTP